MLGSLETGSPAKQSGNDPRFSNEKSTDDGLASLQGSQRFLKLQVCGASTPKREHSHLV